MAKPKQYSLPTKETGIDFHTLSNFYKDLRKEVLTSAPIQASTRPLLTLQFPNWRGGNYGWQAFQLNRSLIILEYFGEWTGYAHELPSPSPPEKDAHLRRINLTIHDSNPDLEKRIEKVIKKADC